MSAMVEHRLERLIFFSDAVIAIAITLMIIDVHVPVLATGDINAGVRALTNLLPSFFGFILSFLVIGRFWLAHNLALGGMRSYDPRLFRANLYFLLMIVIMPFATSFLSTNLGMQVPALFYNVTLTLTALANFAIVWIATDVKSGHSAHSEVEARSLRRRAGVVVAVATACIPLALVSPQFSQMPMALILVAGRFFRGRPL